ncbi:F0F1 ATP synthase subunit delta [Cryptosporangium aurantiacum]|uniref:ATP synthase subunit delta n=1 Tax=Cryptosporangium aurantiacum TaxID=134849 RepID=A0A1M7H9E3_9ACTN|nr:F0F1 ATP synthase subunit delta [Cryptosporangium aurantiacum]SHM25016.1 ATP synthase F1 subcomplex delta subunit [Cryptosporangium aurantiacum]
MQGASRESLAGIRAQFAEVTRAGAAPAGASPAGSATTGAATPAGVDRVALAADLRAVADLLGREPGLRRALADASKPTEARTGLLEALVGQRVGQSALDVLWSVVAARWSSAHDLVDAVELLAVDAELAEADANGSLAEVEDQLFRFARIVDGHPRLGQLLSDATAPVAQRAELATGLLEGHADPVTVRLVRLAVQGLGGRGFDASLARLVELTAARRDREIAYVTAASPLSPAQEERLTARLAAIYGRAVSLKVEVDPSLLGGVTVRVGDDLYDGSVARRLEQARGALTN